MGGSLNRKVLLKDELTDLAILKIDAGEPLPALPLADSDKVEVGDLVLAIGNPFGVGQTVTSGIVSAQARTRVGISDFDFFIQTDAAINPGNSGGALIDMSGKLIGINTAIFSRSGGSIGIGFAIPSNMVRAVVETAKGGADTFERPYIGATFQNVTPDVAEGLGMKQPYGALVTNIGKGGPSEKGGLLVGDVVLSVDGVRIENPDGLGYRLSTAGIGKTIQLQVLSRSKEKTIAVVLEKPGPDSLDNQMLIQGRNPLSGAHVLKLTPSSAARLNLPSDTEGVAVDKVFPNTPAARIGLQPGDIVRGINGNEIETMADLTKAMSSKPVLWRFDFERGGDIIRQVIRLRLCTACAQDMDKSMADSVFGQRRSSFGQKPAARGPVAAKIAKGSHRSGAPDRARRGPDAHDRGWLTRLDDLLGTARDGQDDRGAASGQ